MPTMPPDADPSAPSAPPLCAILAGGQSRRFGSPKALARIGGRTVLERVREALGRVADDPVLISHHPALIARAGLPHRPDARPGGGALSGVHTALLWARDAGRPGALCVACDMPFLEPALLAALLQLAAGGGADAVAPMNPLRDAPEPLCAWYGPRALPVVERRLRAGDGSLHGLLRELEARTLPAAAVRALGDPARLFFNLNTMPDLERARRAEAGRRPPMHRTADSSGVPPVVAVVGRKNSGKTTLLVALAAELKRRGLRVASLKHGHHDFEIDQPGRDSWRHFHEGEVEAVVMAAAGKVALVMRTPGEADPEALVRRFYAGLGYDVVLVEGYKHGPFQKIEVFRRAVHDRPIHDPADAEATGLLALVSDTDVPRAACPVVRLDAAAAGEGGGGGGAHVAAVADLVQRHLRGRIDAER